MSFDVAAWQRFDHPQGGIYLRGDLPSWFVPNSAGDQILQQLMAGEQVTDDPIVQRFLQRLPAGSPSPYLGRYANLETDRLSELWLHITNRCDLSCRHCLFTSGPQEGHELSYETIVQRVDEAVELGCRVFALTGGEPFVHPRFVDIVQHIQSYAGAHVAVLTNGMSLQPVLQSVDWDWSRFHLQLSVDGLPARHDHIRGAGSFAQLESQMKWLREQARPFTLSMCVERDNLNDMAAVVDIAADCGASNVHFMWYFICGRGKADLYVEPTQIFAPFVEAWQRAQQRGISIDNLDALKTQVFAPSGTIHDGSGCGWNSVAIGADGALYPSAALVGVAELATPIEKSLAYSWRNSDVLERIRRSSCVSQPSPWRFILGGGDSDHSYHYAHTFVGDDPYLPLYQKLAIELIQSVALRFGEQQRPSLRLKMGDCLESCGAHGKVALLHSNCLLALTQDDSRSVVKNFYAEAVGDTKEDILNPVCYEAEIISHIPTEFRLRGYGCGSPVLDAEICPGETVLDLGCGSGVECFIASRLTGSSGQVIGVDMLDPMLDLARRGSKGGSDNLGYDNLDFRKGFLEQLPVADNSVDLILSNCVLNLSSDKRRLFAEIFRVLKPGGRLVVADVVCEIEPDAAIRNDEVLRGECIAGALSQKDLNGLLDESGFQAFFCLKRVPYRSVQDHPFYSLTFRAAKPEPEACVRVMYPGPFPTLQLANGQVVVPGQVFNISAVEASAAGSQLYHLDEAGHVTNVEFSSSCNCALPPQRFEESDGAHAGKMAASEKKSQGCMVCGAPLIYETLFSRHECHYCGRSVEASENCEQGHYVCDQCHSTDSVRAIESICFSSPETDMLRLFHQVRRHPAIPLHGPQFHALVPAVILATYRNRGGKLGDTVLATGISRGSQVIGGSCAYNGICGAAVGVGIAFSLILEANPVKADQRQTVQTVVQRVLKELADFNAARCCNRDCVVSLQQAAKLSQHYLPLPLVAQEWLPCDQHQLNSDCLGTDCPLF